MQVKEIVEDFKHTKLSGSLTALYTHRTIQQICGGLIGLFLPVFLLNHLGRFESVIWFYFLNYGLWLLVIPLGAMLMSKIGLKKSLMISVVFGVLYYVGLRAYEVQGFIVWLCVALFFINLDRLLYWVPFHTDFAKFTNKKTRGKQMAFLSSVSSLVSVILPFVSGYIIQKFGFDVLFIVIIFIYIFSIVPLFLIREVKETFSYSYLESYKEVFKKKNRKMGLSYFADGMESMAGMVIWPIFIWQVLENNYEAVGIISSLIILSSIVLRLLMGEYTDKFDKHKVLKIGTILNSIAWVIKIFVGTAFQIFIASTYHSFANIVMRTPFDAMMYEKAADSGHYIDEYTVVREIALNIGRLVMLCCILGIFVLTGSIEFSFIFAAGASVLISIL